MSDALTPSQRNALTARGVSIALSASAGCGKTTVLTRRYLGHLDDDEPLDLGEITALTFTEKAARELRGRVRRECRAQMASGRDAKRWRLVLRGLESAAIQTFHGFCGEILRRFPLEAGVEPEFGILEEAIGPTFRDEVLGDCLRDWLARKDENLIRLAEEMDLEPLREALAGTLSGMSRDSFRDWANQSPEQIVAVWEESWSRELKPRLIQELVERARPLLALLGEHKCTNAKMKERIAVLNEVIPRLGEAKDAAALLAELRENARVQGGGNEKNWTSPSIYNQVRDGLAAFREAIKALGETLDYDPEATALAADLGRRFAALAADAVEAYAAAKRAAGVLDFDDLILKTLRLLHTGPDEVREAIKARCRALLVDEFQDTDSAQGEILKAIAGAELTSGGLFLVGDFKQSIYRFRGAEPRVFDDFKRQFPAPGRLSLNENFRSTPGIIQFANALFGETFEGAEHELRVGARHGADAERAAVEFLWARDPNESQPRPLVSERRKTEARWLARILARRLSEGWTLVDPRTGESRQAHAGHVVFLFRSLGEAAVYEQALAAEGLDYHVVGGSAFYGQQEVLDLINVLSVIEDPFDEVALAGALRSPFACVSDDGLYWLSTATGGLISGFSQWEQTQGLNAEDRARAGRLAHLLEGWRRDKDAIPIARLVDRVLTESGHEAALAGEFLGERKRANARKLVRLARRFDAQGSFTLSDFVARLRADYRKPPREEQAATADEASEAIRLMTIHQAKGLEFPIVVIPDLNRDAPQARARFVFHRRLGPIFRPERGADFLQDGDSEDSPAAEASGRILGWQLYKDFERRDDRDEAFRLFYVAVTRAQNHLILSSGTGPDEPAKSPALQLLATRFDRVTGHCVAELPGSAPSPRIQVLLDPPAAHAAHIPRLQPNSLEVARFIETAAPAKKTAQTVSIPTARAVDLSPTRGLSALTGRVDALVREVLFRGLRTSDSKAADAQRPKRLAEQTSRASKTRESSERGLLEGAANTTPAALDRAIERASSSLGLIATPIVAERARELLRAFLESPVGGIVRTATETLANLCWSTVWPSGGTEETIYRGSLDLACRDTGGSWRLIVVSDPSVPCSQEKVRLMLSARVASQLGLGEVAEGLVVSLDAGSETQILRSFTDREIADAIAEFDAIGQKRLSG
jgi:ATP-dependent helicase/nuclease subunit A